MKMDLMQRLLDRLVVAVLAMVAVAVLMGIALASVGGGLTPRFAGIALFAGILAGGGAAAVTRGWAPARITLADGILFGAFGLASLRAFLWLIVESGDTWRVLSPHNLGDVALHIQFIRYFAAGAPFWPESPILSGTPLVYPVGADLWNSLLLSAGLLPVERGLVVVGLAGTLLAAWSIWRWSGGFGLAMLLFNGGLAGWMIFRTGAFDDYQSGLAWKNLFLTMFVTQRGLLYALPCGMILLRAWRDRSDGKADGLPFILQWLFYATLPLFQVHTFLYLSFILAALFAFQPGQRRYWLGLVALAVVPATLCMLLVTGFFSMESGFRWLPGWLQGEDGVWFWILNFGVALLLPPALFWRGIVRGDASTRAFVSVAIGMWVLCLLVAIAPWAWDNTKLMFWAWLGLAPFIWQLVLRPMPVGVRSAACLLLFLSGAVSLYGGLDRRHGYTLASRSELAQAKSMLQSVPPLDRIAAPPEYNTPAILLGRPVVCGYEGHLWSHGLDYQQTLEQLKNVQALGEDWDASARAVGAKWIWLHIYTPLLVAVPEAEQ